MPGRGTPTPYTPFWLRPDEVERVASLPPREMARQLGLPPSSTVAEYDIWAIRPRPGEAPRIFDSEIAPLSKDGFINQGGGQQVLVPNRGLWTEAELLSPL